MPTYPNLITLRLTVRIGVLSLASFAGVSGVGETKQFFIRIMFDYERGWEISRRLLQEFARGTATNNACCW